MHILQPGAGVGGILPGAIGFQIAPIDNADVADAVAIAGTCVSCQGEAGGNADDAVGVGIGSGREGSRVGGAGAGEVGEDAASGADVGRGEVCGGF